MNISSWLPKTRIANPVSKLFRPLFEAKKAKAAFGGLLSASSFVLAIGAYPFVGQSSISALEPMMTMAEIETVVNGPARLLPDMKTVSQGFWSAHPGIDITAPKGSPIYPIRPGKVKEVAISQYNYGRNVTVDHGDGTTSLYAHMGKIYVDEGDEVTEARSIGEVGMSGRTTGPHLHLEVRKNGAAQNPIQYLRTVLASK